MVELATLTLAFVMSFMSSRRRALAELEELKRSGQRWNDLGIGGNVALGVAW